MRPCKTCGTPIEVRRDHKAFCGDKCRMAAWQKKRAEAQEERERQAVERALADRDHRLERLVETLAREVGLKVEDLI